ncbi:MAG: DUF4139 domain-containing protein [Sedimentisphaerales bacterium]|nr:DUF4139 domain-containing protein [Sedimentisphaerales bacterium]
MKRHITDDQLLQLAFDLANENQAEAIRSHLAECETCRRRQEQLQAKFTVLDVLRDEPQVTDELLQRTLTKVREAKSISGTPWWRSKALAAVAAGIMVLLVAVSLFTPQLSKARKEVAQDIHIESAEAPSQPAIEKTSSEPMGMQETRSAAPPLMALSEEKPTAVAGAMVAGEAIGIEWQPEEPPFAPASNIELVTLPRRESVQLTIYNAADLTLVREQRKLTLQQGWNWLQFMWANTLIDPTSLSLEPKQHSDKIEVEQLSFPPRLPAVGRWLIKSRVAGEVPIEITYFTSGLHWRAFYMGTLTEDEAKMDLTGYVRVDNQTGEDYENAQVRLLVGKVNLLDDIASLAQRKNAYGKEMAECEDERLHASEGTELSFQPQDATRWYFLDGDAGGLALYGDLFALGQKKEIKKEGLSEYFLYTIEGIETIPNGWGKRLESFQAEDIPVENMYKYDRERWANEARRFLTFTNDEDHKLGETPIPDGRMRIYHRVNEQGELSYVGGCDIKYIPVGEEVELDLGAAQQVKVEPVLMAYATDDYDFADKGYIAGWVETNAWTVKLTNARPLPVKIRFEHAMDSPNWQLTDQQGESDYEAWDAIHLRFTQIIEPRTQKEFSFTTEELYGTKREKSATDSTDEH